MNAKVIGTIIEAKKKKIEDFGILEIDGDLLRRQQEKPIEVTKNCRRPIVGGIAFSITDFHFPLGLDSCLKEDKDADAVCEDAAPKLWAYCGYLVKVTGIFHSDEERTLLVKEAIWKREKRFAGLKKMADFADFSDRNKQAGDQESKDRDAVAAIRKLGVPLGEAKEAVRIARSTLPEDASVEDVIKRALKGASL